MIIIAGHMTMAEDQRDAVVAAQKDLVTRARGFDGCLDLAITADSVDPMRVNNVEVWRDKESLEAWRAQADPPDLPEPEAVEMKRYDAQDGGPLFDENDD